MDRKIIYPGAIPLENDLLETNRFSMVGLAKLAEAIMGKSTFLHGLACRPTSPASMAVTVGAGEIYSLQNVDDTAYSSLPADTTHSILKQGLLVDAITLPLQAPSTNGLSQNYLIQMAYEESDTESTVLPYYNASNPTQAWHGPNNSGTAQGTVRSGKCIVKAKAGIAATTGTQTTPGPDSGYIGAFVVMVAAGQTELTSANIIMVPGAPFLPAGGLIAGIQSSQMTYARDYGTVNAYAADFTPPVTSLTDGMRLTFLASGANTGASTFSPNGLPAAPVYSNTNTALTGGEILASAQIEVIWNSTLSAWVLANTNLSALSKGFVRTVNSHEPDNGNVQLGSAADADIVTSMTDTTAGRAAVVGWLGNGSTVGTVTTDIDFNTRAFIQGEHLLIQMDTCKNIPEGLSADTYYFAFVHSLRDGDACPCLELINLASISERWTALCTGAAGSRAWTLVRDYNSGFKPSAADIRAVAVSSVFAKAGTDLADASALPANTVSFCYSDAAFSPGYEATILDVGGLGDGSGYRVQYAVSYADGGKQLKFRALNGDNGYWGSWTNVLTNYGGDVDHLSNASFYHINPAAWPGAGAFANQYADPTAPFIIPYGRVTPKDVSQFLPIIKALSATEEYGFGAAVSFGILRTGKNDFGSAVIHIIGDNGTGAIYQFNANGDFNVPGQIGAGGNIVAGQGLYESGGAVRVYSPNNPPPSTTFDGGDWWQDNSSGWIIQTGIVNRADYSTGVTFPRAFPNQCKGVFLTLCNTVGRLSDSGDNIRAMNVSNTGFVYGANGTPEQTSFYVAFGR